MYKFKKFYKCENNNIEKAILGSVLKLNYNESKIIIKLLNLKNLMN